MTRRGGIYRIFIKCSIFILAFAAVFCGFMRSYSESGTLEAVFDRDLRQTVWTESILGLMLWEVMMHVAVSHGLARLI